MNSQEKRQHKRVPVAFAMLYMVKLPIAVRLYMGGRERSAVAQDIGEGGLALLTNFEIPVDSLLLVKFTITNEAIMNKQERTQSFELDAQVCYCRPGEDGSYRLGVSFINIVPTERLFIANYIRTNALVPKSDE
ncbi:MAG TPA: PilZ domain-containing protein [Candidatus Omnitrophota bacterium]|nr:PilZ domain-containing protein [Candidatus Omnitrophota bacterium]HPT39847.1 PilZ domain-containing protein [Candidatus Omnitrophota bacterium]